MTSPIRRAHPVVILVSLAGGVLAACQGATDEDVRQASLAAVERVAWDPRSQMKQLARTRGGDSWTPTWASDGNLYTG
jgi:hypothetical protein